MIRAVRWIVRGIVQGVGFRVFIAEQARGQGLAGFVRNLSDGAVEIEAYGPGAQLDALDQAVRQGPPGARVDHIETLPIGHETVPATFSIAPTI